MKLLAPVLLSLFLSSNAPAARNALTPEEARSGYQLLFNGRNSDGWVTEAFGGSSVQPESSWNVLEPRKNQDLYTKDSSFRNFDLKLEWAISRGGVSGIAIRYFPKGNERYAFADSSGPMASISDNQLSQFNTPRTMAGACYYMFPVHPDLRDWYSGAGGTDSTLVFQYNQFRIVAFERHVAHYGNGRKLLEYTIGSPAWDSARQKSRYRDRPLFGDVHPGSIFLLEHGYTVRFRDIRIKNLGDDPAFNPWALGSPYLNNPGDTASGLRESWTFEDNYFESPPVSLSGMGRFAPGAGSVRRRPSVPTHGLLLFRENGRWRLKGMESLLGRGAVPVAGDERILLPSGSP